MKNTVKEILEGLEVLNNTDLKALAKVTDEEKANYTAKQIKKIKVNFSNKELNSVVNSYITAVTFKQSINDDLKILKDELDINDIEEKEKLRYSLEVKKVGFKCIDKSIARLKNSCCEMQKAIIKDDLKTFNLHFNNAFNTTITRDGFNQLALLNLKFKELDSTSDSVNAFMKMLMSILVQKQKQSGSYSSKKIENALELAKNDVPSISFKDSINMDSSTVYYILDSIGYEYDSTTKYENLLARATKALHTSVVVQPGTKEQLEAIANNEKVETAITEEEKRDDEKAIEKGTLPTIKVKEEPTKKTAKRTKKTVKKTAKTNK